MDSGLSPEDNTPPELPSSGMLRERRFKLSRACDRCRRRRIKCDEGHPCQSCLNANSACTFEEPGKRTHPHKSKRASTLEDRMTHLENLIQSIPSNVFSLGQFDPSASTINPASLLPLGVPPPALSIQPLINPSTHFRPFQGAPSSSSEASSNSNHPRSYLYLDDQGSTRWQGETSGLPLLDLLVERDNPATRTGSDWTDIGGSKDDDEVVSSNAWFPDRKPMAVEINPAKMWKIITAAITPDLMDSLVQCFLSTTHYMMPFLHVPTFLADYGNPVKWGEPGFAAFILAVCCLASRHSDDPRVRSDPNDSFSAGAQWFELFSRLRTLPTSDRPTLYTVQSVLVAGIYAVGLGKLSRAFSLLSEAITLSIDTGLHRSVSDYDHFDAVEQEVRKRTFWCVYIWDKQIGAVFGRPPMIRLRDCDVEEPHVIDDEFITASGGIKDQPQGTESRIGGFVIAARLFVVMEAVLDAHPSKPFSPETSPFLARASATLSSRQQPRSEDLREEEMLLDDIVRSIPPYWAHTQDTMASEDVIRITQAERIHSLGQFVAMVIHRWRFSALASLVDVTPGGAEDAASSKQGAGETYSTRATLERQMKACHSCALQIITSHLHMATRGLMTYFGVHVIHQLTQAGRTLVAILLECKTPETQQFIKSSLEALRSCVGLLRRFSGRYVCGLRSAELIEEVCRLSHIQIGNATPGSIAPEQARAHPPWLRPVRRKSSTVRSGPARSASSHSGQRSASTHSGYDSSDSPLGPDSYVGYPPAEGFDYSRVGRAPRPPSSYAGSSPEVSMSSAYESLSPRHPGLTHPYATSGTVTGPSNPKFSFPNQPSPRSHFGSQPSPRTYGGMSLDTMDRSGVGGQSDADLMAMLASGSPSSGPGGFENPFSMYHQHTPEPFGNPVVAEGSPPSFGSPSFGGPLGGGGSGRHPHTPTGGAGPGQLTYLGLAGGGMRRLGGSPSESPV